MKSRTALTLKVITLNAGGYNHDTNCGTIKRYLNDSIQQRGFDFIGIQEAICNGHRVFDTRLGSVPERGGQSVYILYNNLKWSVAKDRHGSPIITKEYRVHGKTDSRPLFGCLFTANHDNRINVLVINAWLPHGSQRSLKGDLEGALNNIYNEAMNKAQESGRGGTPRAIVMTGDFNEYFEDTGKNPYDVPISAAGVSLQRARTEWEVTVDWSDWRYYLDNVLYWSLTPGRTQSTVVGNGVGSDHFPVECTLWL